MMEKPSPHDLTLADSISTLADSISFGWFHTRYPEVNLTDLMKFALEIREQGWNDAVAVGEGEWS